MPRVAPDHSGRVEPQMALPFSSHPIFHLRKAVIIIAIIGIILFSLSSQGYYSSSLPGTVVFLAISAIICVFDLYHYAVKKVENPDEDPKWPQPKWIFVDFVMALILQFVFWGAIISLSDSYGYGGPNIIAAYGALAEFLCS